MLWVILCHGNLTLWLRILNWSAKYGKTITFSYQSLEREVCGVAL
jgi:hypothetical protein